MTLEMRMASQLFSLHFLRMIWGITNKKRNGVCESKILWITNMLFSNLQCWVRNVSRNNKRINPLNLELCCCNRSYYRTKQLGRNHPSIGSFLYLLHEVQNEHYKLLKWRIIRDASNRMYFCISNNITKELFFSMKRVIV